MGIAKRAKHVVIAAAAAVLVALPLRSVGMHASKGTSSRSAMSSSSPVCRDWLPLQAGRKDDVLLTACTDERAPIFLLAATSTQVAREPLSRSTCLAALSALGARPWRPAAVESTCSTLLNAAQLLATKRQSTKRGLKRRASGRAEGAPFAFVMSGAELDAAVEKKDITYDEQAKADQPPYQINITRNLMTNEDANSTKGAVSVSNTKKEIDKLSNYSASTAALNVSTNSVATNKTGTPKINVTVVSNGNHEEASKLAAAINSTSTNTGIVNSSASLNTSAAANVTTSIKTNATTVAKSNATTAAKPE